MTQVCIVGDAEVNLEYELLSRETARNALATYDLREPFANCVAVETVSVGASVSLLNDLNWYLVRFASDAMVYEPSVSDGEWLSRDLAAAVRDEEIEPDATDRFLKIYGVVDPDSGDDADEGTDFAAQGGTEDVPVEPSDSEESQHEGSGGAVTADAAAGTDDAGPPALVEPMYVTRTGPDLPKYDLRPVDDTLVVRVTEDEFGGEKQR